MSAPELASEALAAWDGIAPYWDEGIGKDGNKYWSVLQEPCLARLFQSTLDKFKLAPGSAPCRALDLATGNGLCARWLAARGAKVVATDGSEAMVEIAKGRSVGVKGVEFRKLDVTSDTDFEALVNVEEGGRGFNIVLMNMAIMDVADIEPLARALPKLLAKDGVFVATLLHPVFVTSNAARNIQIDFNPDTGEPQVVRSKVIKEYLFVSPAKGDVVPGQPNKQIYFHRPMCDLFGTFFQTGLVMDAMEELAFTEADQNKDRVGSSCNYTQLPMILAFRMRLPSL